MERDVFICHTSEDKMGVVRPLVTALQSQGITCWVDEAEIHWGDSITQKVNDGIKISRYVIVVLSQAFLNKNWPKRELNAVLNIEASSGEIKLLPLLIGDKNTQDIILGEFPLLNDKLYLSWDGTPDSAVAAMRKLLSIESEKGSSTSMKKRPSDVAEEIPLPKIRKSFTQWDKDLFLKNAFGILKEYFRRGLSRVENEFPQVKTDFTDIHSQKFVAKIYMNGEIKSQCKIWVVGLSASNEIAYSENRMNIDNDNSYNEILTIEDDGFDLYLNFLMGTIFKQEKRDHCTPTEAAEVLWRRFISPLA